jgi:hypothetical protein
MSKDIKCHVGGSRAALKTFPCRSPNPIHTRIKAAIVRLAVMGMIPTSFATWLIQRGKLKDA